jgi:excisionase family DNA binding protein
MAEAYTDWLPKRDVAKLLGISERTLDRKIYDKDIPVRQVTVPGRRPLAVIAPAAVEALKAEMIPTTPGLEKNGKDLALRPALPPAMRDFFQALLTTLPYPPRALFLTLKEAAAYSGLTQAYLRRRITEGNLPVIRDAGYKIAREDLDNLAKRRDTAS